MHRKDFSVLGRLIVWSLVAAWFGLSFAASSAPAFHFPWDQGHDTFTPFDPPPDPDEGDQCRSSPSPYVCITGAYTSHSRDLFIPGRVSLELIRTYHSRDRHNGMFGHGWMFNYGIRLIEATDGAGTVVIVRRLGSHRDRFKKNPDGTYASPADVSETLTQNADGSWRLRQPDGVEFGFDGLGNLTSLADRNNNKLVLSYESGGWLAAVTDDSGRTLAFTKGANGKVARVTDPVSRMVQYEYDSNANLVRVTTPGGAVTQYAYDSQGNLASITDPSGNVVAHASYDALGRVTRYMEDGETFSLTHQPEQNRVVETDTQGNTRIILYNDKGNITSKSDYSGNVETVAYDAAFNPAQIKDKNGNLTSYAYDSRGNIIQVTDPLGNVTEYVYDPTYSQLTTIREDGRTTEFYHDAKGNVVEQRIVAGSTSRSWAYIYDAQGQLLSVDGPRTDVRDVTTYTYDPHGNVASVVNGLGHVTRMFYDEIGQLVRTIDPSGLVTVFAYDADGHEISRTVGAETTRSTYDARGLLTAVTTPPGLVTQFQYDAFGRVTAISQNGGDQIRFTLDKRGNILKEEVLDAAGAPKQTRSYEYDKLNQLTKETGAFGQATRYAYDNNGNRIRITDALGRVTARSYDALDRLVRVVDPADGQTHYFYGSLGHLSRLTDPLGNSTDYAVNGFGDTEVIDSPDGGTTTRSFDPAGNVLTETDAAGRVKRFEYNEIDLPVRILYGDGSQETRTYEAGTSEAARLTSISDPQGSISWSYDAQGRVTERRQQHAGVTLTLRYSYDAQGRLTQLTYPSGRTLALGYDATGRANRLTWAGELVVDQVVYHPFGPVAGWTWGNGNAYHRILDLDGNLIAFPVAGVMHSISYDAAVQVERIAGTSSRNFGYDALGRLATFAAPGVAQTYEYDGNGNRLSMSEAAQTTTYSYGPGSNRLQSRTRSSTQNYTYDRAGNLLADGSRNYSYDARGRLVQVSSAGSPTTYRYNGLGQRVSKTPGGGGAASVLFAYDEEGRLIGEYDGSGVPILETIYLEDLPIAAIRPGPGAVHYVYTDQIGAPRSITDTLGKVVWQWESDPFGVGDPSTSAEFAYNLRFPGQYYDEESGLHYNYFRDYDPTLGRFIQFDPIGLGGGLNPYLYAYGNPVSLIDPSGEAVPAAIAIRLAIAAAWRALQRAIARCAGNPVCRCRAMYAAYKTLCAIGCNTCNTPSVACCAITTAQASALSGCVSLRYGYIAAGCDRHIPTRADHPGQAAQAARALQNCTVKIARVCQCLQ